MGSKQEGERETERKGEDEETKSERVNRIILSKRGIQYTHPKKVERV